jgi:hypothetical protein
MNTANESDFAISMGDQHGTKGRKEICSFCLAHSMISFDKGRINVVIWC